MVRATCIFYGVIVMIASIVALRFILDHAEATIIEQHHAWTGFAPFLLAAVACFAAGFWLVFVHRPTKRRVY
jgi:hypothetical protein